MTDLAEVARSIAAARRLSDLFVLAAKHVSGVFEAERAALMLHDPVRAALWTNCLGGPDGEGKEVHFPHDQGIAGRVLHSREAMCVPDTYLNPCFSRRYAEESRYVPRSMAAVPVQTVSGSCAGVLWVLDQRVGFLRPEMVAALEAIAVYVSQVLERVQCERLHERQFVTFARAIAEALDARDPLMSSHSANVTNYALGIGAILGMPQEELDKLRMAAMLHDVGKVAVPEVLLTKPGRLSNAELAEIQSHAQYSRDILSKVEWTAGLTDLATIASAHHEKLDGTGYPGGLKAGRIPQSARILAVADIFDALTQTRHNRKAMTTHEALRLLDEMAPRQLDRQCVGALKAFLGQGPWPLV